LIGGFLHLDADALEVVGQIAECCDDFAVVAQLLSTAVATLLCGSLSPVGT
jgi:hypothetical protein